MNPPERHVIEKPDVIVILPEPVLQQLRPNLFQLVRPDQFAMDFLTHQPLRPRLLQLRVENLPAHWATNDEQTNPHEVKRNMHEKC